MEMTISEWNFIQKNTENHITNCKSLQSNIIRSYKLLLGKATCYITYLVTFRCNSYVYYVI